MLKGNSAVLLTAPTAEGWDQPNQIVLSVTGIGLEVSDAMRDATEKIGAEMAEMKLHYPMANIMHISHAAVSHSTFAITNYEVAAFVTVSLKE